MQRIKKTVFLVPQTFLAFSSDLDIASFFTVEDETWVPFAQNLPKQQNKAWLTRDQQRPRIVKEGLTYKKTMLLLAFTEDKKIYMKATSRGETVDAEFYVEFVRQVGEHWRKLRTHPARLEQLFWMHDNARPHTAALTQTFFRRRSVHLVGQSPYSPDLNMCDR